MEARDISRSSPDPYQISLRIRHPSIDPAHISRELKLEPEHCFKAGDPRESSSGSALTSMHAESYWLAALPSATALAGFSGSRTKIGRERLQSAASASITMALDSLIVSFLRQHAEFIRKLQNEEAQVTLLLELSRQSVSGFTLSPQFMRTLSELGIGVDLDFTTD
jgi:hypothetical protein